MKEKDLLEFATELPKPISKYKEFAKTISRNQLTPIGKIKIDVFYAFSHLTNNTYAQNRFKFVGGFAETLKNPLFVFKNKYNHQGEMVDSYYYYKPFVKNGKILHLFNMVIEKNNILYQKTYFNSTSGLKKVEKMLDSDCLVYNHPKIDKKLFETELLGNNPRGVVDRIISNCLKNVNKKDFENGDSLKNIVKKYDEAFLNKNLSEPNKVHKSKERSR